MACESRHCNNNLALQKKGFQSLKQGRPIRCSLRCGSLNFVAAGRPHMHKIVFENDLRKITGPPSIVGMINLVAVL